MKTTVFVLAAAFALSAPVAAQAATVPVTQRAPASARRTRRSPRRPTGCTSASTPTPPSPPARRSTRGPTASRSGRSRRSATPTGTPRPTTRPGPPKVGRLAAPYPRVFLDTDGAATWTPTCSSTRRCAERQRRRRTPTVPSTSPRRPSASTTTGRELRHFAGDVSPPAGAAGAPGTTRSCRCSSRSALAPPAMLSPASRPVAAAPRFRTASGRTRRAVTRRNLSVA
jgi:hypothetical protein